MSRERIWFACWAIATVGLAASASVSAQVVRQEGYYNPYTGASAAARQVYNPYTGSAERTTTDYNRYTGRDVSETAAYNPYTGRETEVRTTTNPYTGRTAYSAATYRRR